MYTLRKRVRFYETDGMRVVYHGNYLNWFEEARVEYMREGGVCLNDLLAEGIVFPIVEMNVKYMKSAVYDDIVLVRAYLREVNRVKLVFEYEVLRENTNELLAMGQSVGTYTKISTGKIVRIPEERLKKLMDNRPIGIMDSGVGGLTVACVLKEKYPNEKFIFIGDTARNPYGNKSPEEVTFFAEEMKAFLAGKQVKMIIAACNTITFSVPPSFFEGKIPVIGMSLDFPELESVNHLAVIGTPMTIRSHRHRDRLKKDFPLMNVTEIPIDGLAYAIEMGKEESFIYRMINKAVQKAGAESVDAAVLACTHYPLVAGVFRDILPNTLLIDPAERTVKKAMSILADQNGQSEEAGPCLFFFTESTLRAEILVKKMFGRRADIQRVVLSGV